ncbi:MAG: histidine--tRNA ligase, partial [Candidatus Omnitrophica bacterium]|nr:histidine--tRNA ligase [Candidatus Omnitrophota bacterium]
GDQAKQRAFTILACLRQQEILSEIDYQDKSLKGQMRQADKLGFKYVAILGEEELNKQIVILRNMQNNTQREIPIEQLAKEIV